MIDDAQVDFTKSVTDRVLRQVEGFNRELADTLRELATRAREKEAVHLRLLEEYQDELDEAHALEERIEVEKWKAIAEMMEAKRRGE